MKTISISELHAHTGYYVSLAASEPITVTDHGKPHRHPGVSPRRKANRPIFPQS